MLWRLEAQALAVVLLSVAGLLVVIAYFAASRTDVDATTEVSALVVLAAGTLAGLNYLALASAMIATTTLFLVEKPRLHALVERIDDETLRAAARFSVMAAVVLPLLPRGPYPPMDTVRPRELWLLVLFFSGLSFAAYVARRTVGAQRGSVLAGLLGGLISSTNVTFTFSRASRDAGRLGQPLAYGAIAASTVLFIRVAVVTAVLNPDLARALLRYLAPPFVLGLTVLAFGLRRGDASADDVKAPSNPLQIGPALQMVVVFQLVLIAVEFVRRSWGNTGIVLSGAVLGLTDVDALTLSMARSAAVSTPVDVAARGLATGILSNTLLKAGIAIVIGSGRFKAKVGLTLVAMAAVIAVLLLR